MKTSTALSLLAVAFTAQACLLDDEIHAEYEYQAYGKPIQRRNFYKRQSGNSTIPIGKGDRFDGGAIAPVGLGIDDRNLQSVLNVREVESALRGLANAYEDVYLFSPPFTTVEDARLHGAIIGPTDPRVLLISGIHARERGGPDNVIYLIGDLLRAQKLGKGLKYGKKTYSPADVRLALSAGIVILPLTNPDGVAYDQKTDSCWRKNRNRASAKGGEGIGIDLNRNFDFLFDYKKKFSRLAETSSAGSNNPSSEVFHGKSPASESETKAIVWTMEKFDGLSWFLDLHSFGGDILYAWGDDNVQSSDPRQNYANITYDGKRGFLGDDPSEARYKEFFEKRDLDAEVSIAETMVDSMAKGGGKIDYTPLESVSLYPTSGGSTDYAHSLYYSRQCGGKKLRALTMEFGRPAAEDGGCPFYPTNAEYHDSMRSVDTGLMELLMNAAGPEGDPVVYEC